MQEAPSTPSKALPDWRDRIGFLLENKQWRQVARPAFFIAIYLVFFLVISELLLRDLKNGPFASDDWPHLLQVRGQADSPWRVFLHGMWPRANSTGCYGP